MRKIKRKIIYCKYCNKERLIKITSNLKFCSYECYWNSLRGQNNPKHSKKMHEMYLSGEILQKKKEKIERICETCKNKFSVLPCKELQRFCSRKCARENPFLRKKQSLFMINRWKEDSYIKKILKSKFRRPNKIEITLNNYLQEQYPNEWKYVGDGQFWIEKLNPDYININGKKLIIELLGCYYHHCPICYPNSGKDTFEKRNEIYGRYGWYALAIWEHEFNKMPEIVNKKIIDFIKTGG